MGGLKNRAHGAVFALRYGKICDKSHLISSSCANREIMAMTTDDKTRTELEAAVFRRLVEHLRSRTDVQNIELMNLAGFCRNGLSNWLKQAPDAKGRATRAAGAVGGVRQAAAPPSGLFKDAVRGKARPRLPPSVLGVHDGHCCRRQGRACDQIRQGPAEVRHRTR